MAHRTRHLDAAGAPRFTNALAEEASPYLRQHAHNPVDWRPWGEAAFAEARARDVPVFLSVGYATCHWCHVMEEECFEDLEVARALNEGFVSVKLDREARPDLDRLYILATQMQQRHAGWPNSVWLDAEARPFHTGTYFPKPQFLTVLAQIRAAWLDKRAEVERLAEGFSQNLRAAMRPDAAPAPQGLAAQAAAQLARLANPRAGGFSEATQFPQEGFILFLLDDWRRGGADESWLAARGALDAIAAGAIHDHVGGGFHRYSVDVGWRTPHFEKMLYNQALLTRCFVEGFELCGDAAYARAARRCLDYVLRDMTAEDGAFYAAEDADSLDSQGRMEEGAFYAWPAEEVLAALGEQARGAQPLNLTAAPTIEAGPVPFLDPAARPDFDRLDPLLDKMRAHRAARPRPLRDDKVIAGWNGLMIRAFAEAAIALDAPHYAEAAARAALAVSARLEAPEGLRRLSARGRAQEPALLEDYAWQGLGCVALWDATGETRWLDRAASLADEMLSRFDERDDRLAMAAAPGPLGPILEGEDGATPAGESSALELLALLDLRRPDPARRQRAEALRAAILSACAPYPAMRADGLRAARILEAGESGARRALGRGVARLWARRSEGALAIEIASEPDWRLEALRVAPPVEIATPPPDKIALPPAPQIALEAELCGPALCLPPERVLWRFAG